MIVKPRRVGCAHNGIVHTGTFVVEGRFVTVTCAHGTHRAIKGLLCERRVAQKLLRHLVLTAERKRAKAAVGEKAQRMMA